MHLLNFHNLNICILSNQTAGTGKTYLGLRILEVLLANTTQWPILIVCYTNHALNQFLEGILKICSDIKLVRIGGDSKSKALEPYKLNNMKGAMDRSRKVMQHIRRELNVNKQQLRLITDGIQVLQKNIEHAADTVRGEELVDVISGHHHYQLSQLADGRNLNVTILNWLGYCAQTDDDDGEAMNNGRINLDDFVPNNHAGDSDASQMVTKHRKSFKNQIIAEIKRSESMAKDQAILVPDISQLPPNDRWNLYRLWLKLYVQELENKIKEKRDEHTKECLRTDDLNRQKDIAIVKDAKIVGMTTTGAAKYRYLIDAVQPKITSKPR